MKEGRKERKEEEDNKRRGGVRERWNMKESRKEVRIKGVWEQRLNGGRVTEECRKEEKRKVGRKEGRRQQKIGKGMNERKERRREARRQEFRDLPFLHPYQEKTPLQQIFFSSHLQCGKIS